MYVIAEDGIFTPVFDGSGKIIGEYRLPNQQRKQRESVDDKVYNYSINVVQLGLLLDSLLDMVKVPDRNRGLRLLKLTMAFCRAHNSRSKYAAEILRLLVHQYYTLSTKRCNEEFYGLFVKSESDSHIPCDLNMEYIVKEVKWNIKHMGSGQNEEIIKRRTAAIHGLKEISKKFDVGATVIKRYQHHAHITDIGDKLEMLQCIYDSQPFAKV